MSALLSRPEGHESFGGKGVTIAEVLKFLQDINPGAVNKEKSEDFLGESISIDTTIPLINGNALAIVFLGRLDFLSYNMILLYSIVYDMHFFPPSSRNC